MDVGIYGDWGEWHTSGVPYPVRSPFFFILFFIAYASLFSFNLSNINVNLFIHLN
jgi:hypothetical protein